MAPVYTCAGCGKPIFGGIPYMIVTDFADVESGHAFAGFLSRFIHNYVCLRLYAEKRERE